MKPTHLALISFALCALVIGCAGGGGGGGTTTSGTTSGTTGGTDYPSTAVGSSVTRYQGQLVIDGFTTAIPNVRIYFYNAGGSQTGSVRTNSAGKFWLDIDPAFVASFRVDKTTINTSITFHPYMLFLGDTFGLDAGSCRPNAPTATKGAVTWISGLTIPLKSDPPPSPPGC